MSEIIFGSIMILISVFFFIVTFTFPPTTIALSPAVFPRFVSVSLFLLALVLLGQGLYKWIRFPEKRKKIKIERAFLIRSVLTVAVSFLYIQLLNYLDYILVTPLLIAGAMLIFGEKKWYRLLIVPVVTTALLYVVFRLFFRVPLPHYFLW